MRHAMDDYKALLERKPGDLNLRVALVQCFHKLGHALWLMGKPREGRGVLEEGLALAGRLAIEHPDDIDRAIDCGLSFDGLGRCLLDLGQYDEAEARFRQAISRVVKVFSLPPERPGLRQQISIHYGGLTMALRGLGRAQEAAQAEWERARLSRGNPGQLFEIAWGLAQCLPALDHKSAGQPPVDASVRERLALEAVATLRQAIAAGYRDLAHIRSDSLLDPLRARPDFQLLMMDLAMPADPFAW